MPQLFVLSGADVGRSFDVGNGSTLGRSPDCDVVLKDRSVSRRHAHIERKGPGWVLVDDGSRNGIKLGEEKVPRAELADGQEVIVGELLMRFRAESTAAEVAPAAAAPATSGAPAAEEDEIVLEGIDDEPEPRATAAPRAPLAQTVVVPRATPPPPIQPAMPVDTGFGRASGRAGEQLSRAKAGAGDRVLQYHKVADHKGVMAADLAQYPGWVRFLVFVVVLALAGGLFYAAFFGTSFLKEKVQGPPEPEAETGE